MTHADINGVHQIDRWVQVYAVTEEAQGLTLWEKKKPSQTKTEILLYPDVDLVMVIYVTDPGIPPVFQQ